MVMKHTALLAIALNAVTLMAAEQKVHHEVQRITVQSMAVQAAQRQANDSYTVAQASHNLRFKIKVLLFAIVIGSAFVLVMEEANKPVPCTSADRTLNMTQRAWKLKFECNGKFYSQEAAGTNTKHQYSAKSYELLTQQSTINHRLL